MSKFYNKKIKDLRLKNELLPKFTPSGEFIAVGCNYHTKWQSDSRMRFVLKRVQGDTAYLATRTTGKYFSTKLDDLIFIKSGHNKQKAAEIRPEFENEIKYINYDAGR